jgi:hypothetical protein
MFNERLLLDKNEFGGSPIDVLYELRYGHYKKEA